MDEQKNKNTYRKPVDRWMDIHVHIYKRTDNGWKDRRTDRQKTDERLDRPTDKQIVNRQADRQTDKIK